MREIVEAVKRWEPSRNLMRTAAMALMWFGFILVWIGHGMADRGIFDILAVLLAGAGALLVLLFG